MTQSNNISVLPFYLDIRLQNHRKSYAYGAIYPLFVPADKLIPFQIIREKREREITSVKLIGKDTEIDITQQMIDYGLEIVKFEDYDVIVYRAQQSLTIGQLDGRYHIEMSDSIDTWYSEIFTVAQDMSDYIKIVWYDVEDLVFDAGRVVYNNFKNMLYICTELGKPEYQFDEEGETRSGYFFPQRQISQKTYKCNILAPEYLCDAMRFIRMADVIEITDNYGQKYKCDTFLITPNWQTQGDLASVDIEFTTNTVVKKIGKGYLELTQGDFNNDFNNDFKN